MTDSSRFAAAFNWRMRAEEARRCVSALPPRLGIFEACLPSPAKAPRGAAAYRSLRKLDRLCDRLLT
jgi:hypothetical protein